MRALYTNKTRQSAHSTASNVSRPTFFLTYRKAEGGWQALKAVATSGRPRGLAVGSGVGSERVRPLWQRCGAGEASERDMFGNGLPRWAGPSTWVKWKHQIEERLARSASGMTKAQYRGARLQARPGHVSKGRGPSHMLQEMRAGDLMGGAQRLGKPWRRWMVNHAVGPKLLHPGNHVWMQEHTQFGSHIEREADAFAGTLSTNGLKAREHDRIHLGTFPSTRRSRGIVRLQGPGQRKTGSVEACSLLPPPTLTALSLQTMSVGILLYEVQAP